MGLMLTWLSGISGNMLMGIYIPCYPAVFFVAIWSTICIAVLSYIINKNNILSWLGVNSLAIMLMHEPLKRIVIKIYSIIAGISIDELRESIFQSFLMTILVILLLVPIVIFINKYIPFVLGKNNKSIKK